MKCPKCGNEAGNAKFCPECGAPLNGRWKSNTKKRIRVESLKRKKAVAVRLCSLYSLR